MALALRSNRQFKKPFALFELTRNGVLNSTLYMHDPASQNHAFYITAFNDQQGSNGFFSSTLSPSPKE